MGAQHVRTLLRKVVNRPLWLLGAFVVNLGISSGLYAWSEHKGPVTSMWWSVVSGSTTGYGDQYPVTTAGRAIACWLIVSMIFLVAVTTGQVTQAVLDDPDAWTDAEQKELDHNVKLILDNQDVLERQLILLTNAVRAAGIIINDGKDEDDNGT